MWNCWSRAELGEKGRKRKKASGPVEWVRTKLGFDPDRAQARALASKKKRVILNCTRQWGKSTVTAALAVMEAVRNPGSLTLVLSPSARQSGEFIRKAAAFVRLLQYPVTGDGDNEISLLLPNGSRIVGLPGNEKTVRGFSKASLIIVDEAARVDDALYLAIRPSLAVSGGTLWLLSTPRGPHGFFYEAWAHGGPEWEKVQVRAEECGRIDPEFLEEEKRDMGEEMFRQEYCCEFVDVEGWMFGRELTEGLVRPGVEPVTVR
jgi:hypothetical protein